MSQAEGTSCCGIPPKKSRSCKKSVFQQNFNTPKSLYGTLGGEASSRFCKGGRGFKAFSRWWFQIFFVFTPNLGEDSHFDEHIFQMGWFNHPLVLNWVLQDMLIQKFLAGIANMAAFSREASSRFSAGGCWWCLGAFLKSNMSIPKIFRHVWSRRYIFQTIMFGIYVRFRWCSTTFPLRSCFFFCVFF